MLADLKPDNILVSANFSTVKLADFGSAFFETDFDNGESSAPFLSLKARCYLTNL